jgi:hypothetical protein
MDLEQCPECGEMFPEDELQKHYLREHEMPKPEKEED